MRILSRDEHILLIPLLLFTIRRELTRPFEVERRSGPTEQSIREKVERVRSTVGTSPFSRSNHVDRRRIETNELLGTVAHSTVSRVLSSD